MQVRADRFRKEYRTVDDINKKLISDILDKANELDVLFDCPNVSMMPREMALARTNLEQAIMWAVKALT